MSNSTDILVRFADATIGVNGNPVLQHVNLEIRRGSFVALLGPNGSGKSTLMKTLVGILPVLKGQMNYPSSDRAPRFGYVPQRDVLDPLYPLTGFEVVLMGTYGELGPLSRVTHAMRTRARHALGAVRAEGLARRLFSELSGGERQRVLIARALAAAPECLVLDEPVAGIDLPTAETIMDLAAALHREGMTILLVSHHILALRGRVEEVIWLTGRRLIIGPATVMLSKEQIEEMLVSEGA
jgi:ABC-type Mn2+/Zn2+ transport system ATPase subunit